MNQINAQIALGGIGSFTFIAACFVLVELRQKAIAQYLFAVSAAFTLPLLIHLWVAALLG